MQYSGILKRICISRDLKKRGFKFIGAVTIYSHLQACGLINDHAADCPCFHRINEAYPIVMLKPDREAGLQGEKTTAEGQNI